MTNPDNAIGTNGAYNGRTSVDAFNDDLSVYSRGILNGWSCVVSSGLTVALGGVNGVRDVAVATDNNGNNTTINNISQSPVQVTISSAPATNSRIDLVVAYVDNPPQGVSTTADNPNACGLIVVKGSANASPVEPDDGAIRTAITADGASGTTAYYVVLAKVTIASGTTDLTNDNITQGDLAQMNGGLITDGSVVSDKIDWTGVGNGVVGTAGFRKTVWSTIWDIYFGTSTHPNTSGTITTLAGNTYTYDTVNAGTGGRILTGASQIMRARGGFSFQADSNVVTADFAVRGMNSSSTVIVVVKGGLDNGAAATVRTFNVAAVSGNFISQPIQVATGQAGSYTCEYTVTRNLQNNPWWTINGTIYSGYHTNAIDFSLGVRSIDNDSIPALYKNGAGTSSVWNTLKSGSWFEICEPIANQ